MREEFFGNAPQEDPLVDYELDLSRWTPGSTTANTVMMNRQGNAGVNSAFAATGGGGTANGLNSLDDKMVNNVVQAYHGFDFPIDIQAVPNSFTRRFKKPITWDIEAIITGGLTGDFGAPAANYDCGFGIMQWANAGGAGGMNTAGDSSGMILNCKDAAGNWEIVSGGYATRLFSPVAVPVANGHLFHARWRLTNAFRENSATAQLYIDGVKQGPLILVPARIAGKRFYAQFDAYVQTASIGWHYFRARMWRGKL